MSLEEGKVTARLLNVVPSVAKGMEQGKRPYKHHTS